MFWIWPSTLVNLTNKQWSHFFISILMVHSLTIPASHLEVVVETIKTEVGSWSWNMTLMLWPFLVFRETYIFDVISAKRKEIKWRKMPRMNGFIKNHVVDFSVEASEGAKPRWSDTGWRTWPLWLGEICRPPTADSQRSSVFHRSVRRVELGLCAFLQTC